MYSEAIVLLILAVVGALVLITMQRRGPGPMGGFWFYFPLFLFTAWAALVWLTPGAATVQEVYWAGPLAVTVVLSIVLLAVIPVARRRDRLEEQKRQQIESPAETKTRHAVEIGFSAFFWIALIGLGALIFAGYAIAS